MNIYGLIDLSVIPINAENVMILIVSDFCFTVRWIKMRKCEMFANLLDIYILMYMSTHTHTHIHILRIVCYLYIKKHSYIYPNTLGVNCTPPAIEDFPHDLFDEKQRQEGAVVVHVIVSLYLFIALAVVCDKFFVPAVEKICHGKIILLFLIKYFSRS